VVNGDQASIEIFSVRLPLCLGNWSMTKPTF